MSVPKQFVIACGGTGGHLFPGLAVAQELHERGHRILLLVSEKEIDAVALRDHPEFRTEKLPSIGMPALRGIPCYLHESNAIAGRANRLAARWANRVLLGLGDCRGSFPGRICEVTGTPVRRDLENAPDRGTAARSFGLDPEAPTLLVMGGSQGASGINQLMFRAVPFLKDFHSTSGKGLQIIHLTGDRDDQLAAINYQREGISSHVAPFHHRMADAYAAADLVVSRAGAASLSELSLFRLPSVLIPFPFAADRHQHRNAEAFRDAGAAELLEEKNADPEAFALLLRNLLSDERRRERMSASAASVLPRGAAAAVAGVLERSSPEGRLS